MITKEQVLEAVCDVMGVSRDDILGVRGKRSISTARQMAMHLVCELCNVSSVFCGIFFMRDHSTVLFASRKVEYRLEHDEWWREKHRQILMKLSDKRAA